MSVCALCTLANDQARIPFLILHPLTYLILLANTIVQRVYQRRRIVLLVLSHINIKSKNSTYAIPVRGEVNWIEATSIGSDHRTVGKAIASTVDSIFHCSAQ